MVNVRKISEKWAKENNLVLRDIKNKGREAIVLYVKQLNDVELMTHNVIKPLMSYFEKEEADASDAQTIAHSVICCEDLKILDDADDNLKEKILDEILNGMCALLMEGFAPIIVNLKKVERTSPQEADINYSIRGAKDSFTENLDTNRKAHKDKRSGGIYR